MRDNFKLKLLLKSVATQDNSQNKFIDVVINIKLYSPGSPYTESDIIGRNRVKPFVRFTVYFYMFCILPLYDHQIA